MVWYGMGGGGAHRSMFHFSTIVIILGPFYYVLSMTRKKYYIIACKLLKWNINRKGLALA